MHSRIIINHQLNTKLQLKLRSQLAEYFSRLFTIEKKFNNHKKSETNRNDENATCDYFIRIITNMFPIL